MAESNDIALAPYYYRDNYLRLCDTVEAQYSDVLHSDERDFLRTLRELDEKAQCLYVRLVTRTGPWFRESKLQYSELGAVAPILDTLIARDMVEEAQALSAQELGKLFTRGELHQAFPDSGCAKSQDKAALLLAIDALGLEDEELLRSLRMIDTQRIVAPRGAELTHYLQLLFFGNRGQSLTDFVLQDLGVTRYYPYILDREHRLFSCREALDEWLACAAASDSHFELLETGDAEQLPLLAEQVLAINLRYASSTKRWQRLCNALGRDLERLEEFDLALQLYSRSARHPARERHTRILEKRGDWPGAVALCEQMASDPQCEEEHEAALRILPRVKRRLDGTTMTARRDNFVHVTLELAPGSGSVEEQTATALMEQWESVRYVENTLMSTLFGLAFWEQIFESVPGAFRNPFQSVPADMYDSSFRSQRRASLDRRIAQLRALENLAPLLVDAYQRYQGYECRWTHWRYVDTALVEASARIIPGAHLLAIWERMLFDPGENRRGFPDLIALGSRPGDYCLIEVKGPGDALQDSQKRWLRFFQTQGIPAKVAWVVWRND
jgi:VRR-NUC domain